jgi:choline kinase
MKTIILAAGIASRLRPLTDHTPKCLLKVGEKCILELTIENLLSTNNSEIIIVTGYLSDQIKGFVGKRFPDLNITYIHNKLYTTTNNIYSLWLAKDFLLGSDMMMMDSDIVFDKRIITKLIDSGFKNCLALKRHDVHDEEIKVKADEQGRVVEISKEVKPSDAAGESIGIEIFGKEALPELFRILDKKISVENKVNQFYETAFQEFVNNNNDIYIVDSSEYLCIEIDTPEDLQTAEMLLLNNMKLKF